MGCCGNRKKQTRDFADQKWEYINLQDFKAGGCGAPFAYGYLWFSLILSIAVYSVDSFTAVQLIVFNRWSSKVEPKIPLSISRWIFSVCIVLSFINLAFEAVRAFRVIRRGNVADSYMDSLAARWESIRVGEGQGWRRFLVFAALTKSKKGAEYIALFTYFSFQSWIRILLCSGPRQVVNALTLKSVYEAKLSPNSDSLEGNFTGFFDKIGALAKEDYRQAAILSGMAFTFVVWVFSFIYLLLAILFYVFFLFHWIPRADGGLTGYCERKVNKALLKIVTKKVNKALAKNQADRMKAELKAAKKMGEKPFAFERTATLPDIGPVKDDSLPEMPVLGRSETGSSLPPYQTRSTSPGIEMNELSQSRHGHNRTGTVASNASYSARAPLVAAAADMGYAPTSSPAPSFSGIPPSRPATSNSQRSFGPRPGMASNYAYSGPGLPPSRLGMPQTPQQSNPTIPDVAYDSLPAPGHETSARLGTPTLPHVELAGSPALPTIPNIAYGQDVPQRPPTSNSQRSLTSGPSRGHAQQHSGSSFGTSNSDKHQTADGVVSYHFDMPRTETPARMSPAPDSQARHGAGVYPPPKRQYEPYNPNSYGQQMLASRNPYDGAATMHSQNTAMDARRHPPTRSATGPISPRGPAQPPQRSMTGPGLMPRGPFGDYPARPGTSQSSRPYPPQNIQGGSPRGVPQGRGNGYSYDVESQRGGW